MEVTNRQLVSDVIGELRKANIDERLPNRLVLSRLKDKARYFIKQDLDSRRLFKVTTIWKPIKCFSMKSVDLVSCDIPNCECIMRSIDKLPKSYDSNYGTLVKVFTVNGLNEYKQIKFGDYKDIKNREFSDPNIRYFWILDQYIYIPDSEVEEVLVVGLFERPEEVDKLNGEKGSECAAPLDALFPCPEHLLDPVKTQTITEFVKIYSATIVDETPNENSNAK